MREIIKNLVLLAMKAEYDNTAINQIESILKEIFETQNIILKNNVEDYLKDKNYVYIPIVINEEIRFFYEIKSAHNRFGEGTMETLSLILSQMYTNVLVNYPKINESDIDASTKVYNRNSFEKFKKRYNYLDYPLVSCAFIDINGMNEINNSFGHLVGDKVILNVAEVLKNTFTDDKIYRIGGDEFVVIAINKDEFSVIDKLNSAKEILKNNEIYISIGVASGKNILDINCLINQADKAMYEDKKKYYEAKGIQLRKKYSDKRTSSI